LKNNTFETNMKHQIKIGSQSLELDVAPEKISSTNGEVDFTTLQLTPDKAIIKLNNRVFTIRILSDSEDGKSSQVSLNGKTAEIEIKTETDLLLEKLGGNGGRSASAKNIKAPMPGLIVKIHLQPGDSVEKGQAILNFEAMKMENQLKSPGMGVIKQILVSAGDKVEKGQLLVELE
jgi:biotin carboxyl carrier protein